MKIYKANLQELLNEISGPFYLFNSVEFSGQSPQWRTAKVTVAGFNEAGRVCELVLCTHPVATFMEEEKRKQAELADMREKEVRARLLALGKEIRDGRISETEVQGGLD